MSYLPQLFLVIKILSTLAHCIFLSSNDKVLEYPIENGLVDGV